METFWSLLKESIITQSLVTLSLVVTLCVLWGLGKFVPPELFQLTLIVVSFWFGSKIGYSQGQVKGVG
jgi:hypothetical protein